VTTDRNAERACIQAAMDRLLTGTPANSTGALSILQLATEAGVKRWVLTHKHPDLKDEFERRRTEANGVPPAFQNLHARVVDLEAANQRLREANTERAERIEIYAQVIHELNTENRVLRDQLASNDRTVTPFQRKRS